MFVLIYIFLFLHIDEKRWNSIVAQNVCGCFVDLESGNSNDEKNKGPFNVKTKELIMSSGK